MDVNPITHVMPLLTLKTLPCEALLNLDHCFVCENIRSCALCLPTTEGLGLKSDHRYALSLTLDGIRGYVSKPMLRLPRYHIRLLNDKACVASVREAWNRRSGGWHDLLQPTLDVKRRNAQIVKMCQGISEVVLGRRPIGRQWCSSPPLRSEHSDVCVEEDSSIMGSIRLYKRAAWMSRENTPLLPTGEGRRKGLSAIEEVTSDLKARFTPNSRPPPLRSDSGLDVCDSDMSNDDLLMSTKEVVEELRY
jgi:hypothetical protein